MTFYTTSLLSKWGFNDGDILDEFAADYDIELPNYSQESYPRAHQALIEVVKEHILPTLDQKVEVVCISCIHNPIRAERVDDLSVEDFWPIAYLPERIITPATVEVPDEVVLSIVKKYAEKPAST